MQRKSVVGTRSSLLWLLILAIVVVLIGALVGALVILPQMQASRAEQARLAEVERRYQAGVAFQSVEDWAEAESEYRQVIVLDAGYKDATERLNEVRGRLLAAQATATASAIAKMTALASAGATATADALETRYRRAVGLVNMGQWSEAQAELRDIFDVAPDYRDVQRLLPTVNAEVSKLTPTGTPTPRFTTVEVAGGKPATASGYWKGSASNHIFPPENVINRKTDESKEDCAPGPRTYWLLPDRSRGWVQVDLQQNYSIVKLRWLNTHNGICGDRATTRLRIAVSTSGRYEGEEQTVYSGSMAFSKTPDFQEFLLPSPVVARYVRFYVEDYYNWGGGLNEVEVYAQVPVP